MIALHKNAHTTPANCAEMAASSETAAALALRYGVSDGNVYKWKGRDSFNDASNSLGMPSILAVTAATRPPLTSLTASSLYSSVYRARRFSSLICLS
jgi:hypothetical protein